MQSKLSKLQKEILVAALKDHAKRKRHRERQAKKRAANTIPPGKPGSWISPGDPDLDLQRFRIDHYSKGEYRDAAWRTESAWGSVHRAVNRLVARGLVDHWGDRVDLTDEGVKIAKALA